MARVHAAINLKTASSLAQYPTEQNSSSETRLILLLSITSRAILVVARVGRTNWGYVRMTKLMA